MSAGLPKLKSFMGALGTACTQLVSELESKTHADFVAGLPALLSSLQAPEVSALTPDQLQALKACLSALVPEAAEDVAAAETIAEHLLAVVKSYVEPQPEPTPAPTPAPVDPTPAPQV